MYFFISGHYKASVYYFFLFETILKENYLYLNEWSVEFQKSIRSYGC